MVSMRNNNIKIRFIFTTLAIILSMSASAQLQVANWYFGNKAGLNFNVPNGAMPTVMHDGAIQTIEGCSAISDEDGNLLFYTDGIFVWNRNHAIMPGGTGLSGDPSSTQSGIIVPNPANNGIYYIFSIDANDEYYPGSNEFLNGLEFSTVDMSQNGGLGAVVTLNTPLVLEAANPHLCSEKVTAVKHFNQQDIWVITHLRNKFYSFLVTATGVNTTPVISTIAPNVTPDGFVVNARGYIKASPDGKYVAIAHYSNIPAPGVGTNNNQATNSANGVLGLYDFDNQTGVISNYRNLNEDGGTPYGIEFSPNSEYFYAELDYFNNPGTDSPTWSGGKLIQWNLEDLSTIDIVSINTSSPDLSTTWAPTSGSFNGYTTRMRGALQMGIDGRIYYAKTRYYSTGSGVVGRYRGTDISVIYQPNLQGLACDFQPNSYQIYDPSGPNPSTDTAGNNHYVTYGLPPFISSFFNNNVEIDVENVCEGEEANFSLVIDQSVSNITLIEWDMGDGTTYTDQEEVSHTYSSAGTYVVEVSLHIGDDGLVIPVSYELEVFPKPILQNASLVQCDGANIDGFAQFDLNLANDDILVNANGQSSTLTYHLTMDDAESGDNPLPFNYTNTSNPQTIFARVENEYECYRIAELELSVINELFDLESWEVCDDDSNNGTEVFDLTELENQIFDASTGSEYAFYLTQGDSEIDQNRIANITNYTNTSNPQYIYIRVFDGDDCAALGRVQLVVNPKPIIDSGFVDVEVCEGTEVILNPGDFVSYLWSDGSTEPTLNVTESGIYSVEVWNKHDCSSTASVEVIVNPNPEVQNTQLVQCDDEVIDFRAVFRLSDADSEIVVAGNASSHTVTYYLNLDDAMNQVGALPDSYTNISDPQTLIARIENSNGCIQFAELELSVIYEEFEIETMYLCDDESNDGVETFNLTENDDALLNTYGATEVLYFLTEQDAELDVNAIVNPAVFPNQTNPQTLYIRVLNGVSCAALGVLTLEVHPSPEVEPQTVKICPGDSHTFELEGDFAQYEWSTGSTEATITVDEPGIYSVTVWNEFGCSTTENMELIIVQPVITEVIVDGTNIEIIAIGDDPLEYSIDLENWQESNTFTGLPFGIFAAYVRDQNGCVSEAFLFSIISLPNIITPNGDGINDQWNVKGLDIYEGAVIEIYDRYGKLLHSHTVPKLYDGEVPIAEILNDTTPYYVWDGKYLGRAVPSTSYWYIVRIPDGRKISGYLVVKNRNSDN